MAQRRKPVETCALRVFARSKQQVRREIVVDIFTVNGVFDVDGTLTFAQHCRNRRQEGASNFHQMRYPWYQKGCQGGEQTQVKGRAQQSHGVGLELWVETVLCWVDSGGS